MLKILSTFLNRITFFYVYFFSSSYIQAPNITINYIYQSISHFIGQVGRFIGQMATFIGQLPHYFGQTKKAMHEA